MQLGARTAPFGARSIAPTVFTATGPSEATASTCSASAPGYTPSAKATSNARRWGATSTRRSPISTIRRSARDAGDQARTTVRVARPRADSFACETGALGSSRLLLSLPPPALVDPFFIHHLRCRRHITAKHVDVASRSPPSAAPLGPSAAAPAQTLAPGDLARRVLGLCFHGFPKGSPSEKAAEQLQELRRPRHSVNGPRGPQPKTRRTTMTTSNGKAMKKLVAVRKDRNEKNHWTTIGVAFQNSDGSFNLRFDYLPTDPANTTIQLRGFDERTEDQPGDARAA